MKILTKKFLLTSKGKYSALKTLEHQLIESGDITIEYFLDSNLSIEDKFYFIIEKLTNDFQKKQIAIAIGELLIARIIEDETIIPKIKEALEVAKNHVYMEGYYHPYWLMKHTLEIFELSQKSYNYHVEFYFGYDNHYSFIEYNAITALYHVMNCIKESNNLYTELLSVFNYTLLSIHNNHILLLACLKEISLRGNFSPVIEEDLTLLGMKPEYGLDDLINKCQHGGGIEILDFKNSKDNILNWHKTKELEKRKLLEEDIDFLLGVSKIYEKYKFGYTSIRNEVLEKMVAAEKVVKVWFYPFQTDECIEVYGWDINLTLVEAHKKFELLKFGK